MFARVLKANPYHDEKGLFTTKEKDATGWDTAPFTGGAGECKKWITANQQRYDSDAEFKAAVDAVTILTQGGTDWIVGAARLLEGDDSIAQGSFGEGVLQKALEMGLGGACHPMATYKNFFAGQDVEHATTPLKDAVTALKAQIEKAPRVKVPLYRGMRIASYFENKEYLKKVMEFQTENLPPATVSNPVHEALLALKEGDEYTVPSFASFTTDKVVAEQFAEGIAKGQAGKRKQKVDWATRVVIEVEAGAKGLPVSALSPWKQKEVLSGGKFVVSEVRKTERRIYQYGAPIIDVYLVLRPVA